MRFVLLVPILFAGCGLPSVYARKPPVRVQDDAGIQAWVEEIRDHGQDGDWLLTRNYALAGDLIASVGWGESLSHAAVYDKERDMVIEATSPRVQEVTLERFVRRYRRVLLVRPNWLTDSGKRRSLLLARRLVGRPYDWLGLLGFDSEDEYYCSEFVLDVASIEGEVEKPVWVTPAALLDVADVLFDGGIRDGEETRRWARKALRRRSGTSIAAAHGRGPAWGIAAR